MLTHSQTEELLLLLLPPPASPPGGDSVTREVLNQQDGQGDFSQSCEYIYFRHLLVTSYASRWNILDF